MATHTIGTGGDFSTVQAWEDDIPATLTEQRIGQCLNQEFVGDPVVTFSTHTTTSSFNIILEAAAGASFKDNANVRTNPLRYDATKGAALRSDVLGTIDIDINTDHLTIRNLQIKYSGGSYSRNCIGAFSGTNHVYKDLIIENLKCASSPICSESFGPSTWINCLIIDRTTGASASTALDGNGGNLTVVGCTIVRPSNLASSSGKGISAYGGHEAHVINTAVFGFDIDGQLFDGTSNNNATALSDAASGFADNTPDNNVYSVAYSTATFEQPSDASGLHDFRVKSGSALENTGQYDATNSPADISGTSRSNPPEIGAWELAAAASVIRVGSLLAMFQ